MDPPNERIFWLAQQPEKKTSGPAPLRKSFKPITHHFDAGLHRVVKWPVVANVIVFVTVVDINLLRDRSRPKPVHLEVIIAPTMNGPGQVGQMRLDFRTRQVERSAAPNRFIGSCRQGAS